jgi:hypothetical protein
MSPDERSDSESLGSEQGPGLDVLDGAGSKAKQFLTLRGKRTHQHYRIINHPGPIVLQIKPEYEGDVTLSMSAAVPTEIEIQAKHDLGSIVSVRLEAAETIPALRIEAPKVDLFASNPSLLVDLQAADVWKIHLVGTIRIVEANGDIHLARGAGLLLDGDATVAGITLSRFASIKVAERDTIWVDSCTYVRWWVHLPGRGPGEEEYRDTRWRRLPYSLVWRVEEAVERVQMLILSLRRSKWRPVVDLDPGGRMVVNGPFFGPLEIRAEPPPSDRSSDDIQWVFDKVQDNRRPQHDQMVSPRSDWTIYLTDRCAAHRVRFETPEPRWPWGVPILLDAYVRLREVTGTVTLRSAQQSYIHAGRKGLLIAQVGPDPSIDQELSAKGTLIDASLRSVALDGAWLSEPTNIDLLKETFVLDVIFGRDLNDEKFGRPRWRDRYRTPDQASNAERIAQLVEQKSVLGSSRSVAEYRVIDQRRQSTGSILERSLLSLWWLVGYGRRPTIALVTWATIWLSSAYLELERPCVQSRYCSTFDRVILEGFPPIAQLLDLKPQSVSAALLRIAITVVLGYLFVAVTRYGRIRRTD